MYMNPSNALREKEEITNEEFRNDEVANEGLGTDERLTTADIVKPSRPGSAARTTAEVDEYAANQRQPSPGQPLQHNPLFPQDELQNFRLHWDQVQTSFVDEPRTAVEKADSLVANVVKRIAEQFASEREQLEKQWDRGEDVNTEDLRQALKRYRAFFDRLLAF
jgi:hypothetical protein